MSAPEDIKFYFFHHHHYSEIPPDEDKYESTMVDYPNALYDPVKGHELYKRAPTHGHRWPTTSASTASPSTSTTTCSTA